MGRGSRESSSDPRANTNTQIQTSHTRQRQSCAHNNTDGGSNELTASLQRHTKNSSTQARARAHNDCAPADWGDHGNHSVIVFGLECVRPDLVRHEHVQRPSGVVIGVGAKIQVERDVGVGVLHVLHAIVEELQERFGALACIQWRSLQRRESAVLPARGHRRGGDAVVCERTRGKRKRTKLVRPNQAVGWRNERFSHGGNSPNGGGYCTQPAQRADRRSCDRRSTANHPCELELRKKSKNNTKSHTRARTHTRNNTKKMERYYENERRNLNNQLPILRTRVRTPASTNADTKPRRPQTKTKHKHTQASRCGPPSSSRSVACASINRRNAQAS